MSEESKILLSLEIQGTPEQTKQLEDLKIAIQETRNTLLKLKKESKGGSEEAAAAMVKQEIVLKKLNDEYKEFKGIVQAATEAEKGATKTLNTMRAELTKMKADLDDVQIGTAEWTAQANKIKTLSDQIGIAEAKTGSFQRNVGNYANDINRAFSVMGVNTGAFGQIVMGVSQAQSTAAKSAWLWVKGLGGVQRALIATGIGAFIVLLGVLAANWEKIIALFKTATDRAREYAEQQRKIYENWEDQVKIIDANIRRLELLGESEKEIARLKIVRYVQELKELDKVLKAEQNLLKIEMAKGDLSLFNLRDKIFLYTISLGQISKESKNQEEIEKLTKSINELEQKRIEIGNQILEINKGLADTKSKEAEAAKKTQEETEKQRLNELAKERIRAAKEEQEYKNQIKNFDLETDKTISDAILENQKDLTDAIKMTLDERLQSHIDYFDALRTAEEAMAQIQMDIEWAKIDIRGDALYMLQQIAGKESAIGKALFIFERLMAISNIIKNMHMEISAYKANPLWSLLPDGGAAIKTAFIARAKVGAAASIASILATAVPQMTKFASGVIGIQGAGTGTSDSINAKISKGESVITAKATQRYAPALAWMEQSVGNKPNIGGYGRRKFARGVVAAGAGSADFGTLQGRQMKEMFAAISEMKVIVSEKDITNVQNRVKKVNVLGDI